MDSKIILVLILGLGMLFFKNTVPEKKENGNAILSKVDKTLFSIKDKTARVKLVMINLKTGKQKIKKAMLYQKDADKKLFRYTYPKADSGIATLSLPGNQIYLYLPLFKKPKKITSLAESNTFNKTDFSFNDMATKPYSEKYSSQLISTNDTAYVLKLIPVDPGSPYNHLIAFVNKTYYFPQQIEYYDKKNIKIKVATYRFKRVGNNWINSVAVMKNLKRNHKTVIILNDVKINQGLTDDFFKVDHLAGK